MIYQRFGQGVSNLSTVAELRTFDGISVAMMLVAVSRRGGNISAARSAARRKVSLSPGGRYQCYLLVGLSSCRDY
jgi:hypothetical protein